jgi:hypothetical protein
VKKEEPTIARTKITNHNQNVQKNGSYACHIYGSNGHKMIDCPKFAKMQNMSQGKNISILDGNAIVNVKTITIEVDVLHVNVAIRSRIIDKQVLQEKEPRKNKIIAYMEKEDKFKKRMVDTIQQLWTGQAKSEGLSTSMERWNTTWPSMSDTAPSLETPKPSKPSCTN